MAKRKIKCKCDQHSYEICNDDGICNRDADYRCTECGTPYCAECAEQELDGQCSCVNPYTIVKMKSRK